jgi:hypothetical protein
VEKNDRETKRLSTAFPQKIVSVLKACHLFRVKSYKFYF